MTAPKHIAIVGAGVIGAVVAYHLARRGAAVTLLERAEPGQEATAGSFAWFNAAASHGQDSYYRLRLQSLFEYGRLARETGLPINSSGRVEWREDWDELSAESAALAALGYPIHEIDGARLQALEPALKQPPARAVFAEVEGSVEPVEMTRHLLTKAQSLGATLRSGTAVNGLSVEAGRVVGLATDNGGLAADRVVLAAGVASESLAAQAGVALPMVNPPGLLIHTAPAAPLLHRVVLSPSLHMKQDPDGRIVAGRDFGGGPVPNDPWAEGERLLAGLKDRLAGAESLKLESVSTALRPTPRDGFPAVGFAGAPAGLYLAVMHSGITLAPIVGRLAAAEILDGLDAAPLAPFRPTRFAGA